jgi:hypothetical protein
LHYTGSVADVWTMVPFKSTDVDENIIFGLTVKNFI